MFNKIQLSFKLFFSNFSLNLLISLQIVAIMIMGNMIIAMNNSSFECYNLTKSSEELYTYMPEDKGVYNNELSAINKYKDFYSVSLCKIYDIGLFDDTNVLAIGYGKDIANLMHSELEKGIWFTDACKEEGIINCVISGNFKNYPIGTIIDAQGFISGEVIDGHIQEQMKKLQFRVCGYISDNPCIMQMSNVSLDLTCDDLFKKYQTKSQTFLDVIYNGGNRNKQNSSKDLIIICEDEILDVVNLGSSNSIIKFNESISNDTKDEILNNLKNEGIVTSLEDIRTDSYKIIKEKNLQYLSLTICFVVMGILGIICVSIMTIYKNKSVLKIYINCGMTKSDGIKMLFGYFIILLIISLIIFLFLWIILLKFQILPWDSMLINLNNYLFIIISLVCIILIMLGIEGSMLNKFYKRNDCLC